MFLREKLKISRVDKYYQGGQRFESVLLHNNHEDRKHS